MQNNKNWSLEAFGCRGLALTALALPFAIWLVWPNTALAAARIPAGLALPLELRLFGLLGSLIPGLCVAIGLEKIAQFFGSQQRPTVELSKKLAVAARWLAAGALGLVLARVALAGLVSARIPSAEPHFPFAVVAGAAMISLFAAVLNRTSVLLAENLALRDELGQFV